MTNEHIFNIYPDPQIINNFLYKSRYHALQISFILVEEIITIRHFISIYSQAQFTNHYYICGVTMTSIMFTSLYPRPQSMNQIFLLKSTFPTLLIEIYLYDTHLLVSQFLLDNLIFVCCGFSLICH